MLNEFSLSVSKEMYKGGYGEYGYWCYSVKDWQSSVLETIMAIAKIPI